MGYAYNEVRVACSLCIFCSVVWSPVPPISAHIHKAAYFHENTGLVDNRFISLYLHFFLRYLEHCTCTGADSRLAPSQWETLQSNTVSHWLGANLESALHVLAQVCMTNTCTVLLSETRNLEMPRWERRSTRNLWRLENGRGQWQERQILTPCGLVTPYGDINLGQHWLRQWLVAWRHQAITWTSVDLSSVRSSGIHLRAILQEIPQPSVTWVNEISLKISYLKFCSNLPGVNELTHWPLEDVVEVLNQ